MISNNLGNHTATQNIKLGSYWLSNDGSNYGIKVNSLGDVLISGRVASGHEKGLSENNGFEVVTRGRVPERRGISLDDDPSGNVNFWIHNWQNQAAFNFMRNDAGSTKKLMVINKNGQVGINVDNPQYTLHVSGSIRFEQLPQQQQINTESVLISDAQGLIKVSPASQLKDNLGNHTATQNIKLGNYWLSNDGSDKGLQIKSDGNIQVGNGITQVNIGGSYSNAPYYLSSYIGFNAQRNSQGQWLFKGDGGNNGGAAIITDVAGNIRFISMASNGGNDKSVEETSMINNTKLIITKDGRVGIGTSNPQHELDVRGTGHFCVLRVKTQGWCDYVFDENYNLLPLEELEQYIKLNKKLPDIPSENEINTNGIDVATMNKILTKKIEELTLYIIQLNNEIKFLKDNQNKE